MLIINRLTSEERECADIYLKTYPKMPPDFRDAVSASLVLGGALLRLIREEQESAAERIKQLEAEIESLRKAH